MPHVHDGGRGDAARAGYRLGVICNTGMAGGRVLREVLRRHGLLDYFDVTVFSNEFGMSKPHPSIFRAHARGARAVSQPREALHVGDIEELDVEGARRAVCIRRCTRRLDGHRCKTDADFVVRDWRDFGGQVDRFAMPDRALRIEYRVPDHEP